MRTISEITFRLRQEVSNINLLLTRPRFRGKLPDRLELPNVVPVVSALRGSPFEVEVIRIANLVLGGDLAVFGQQIHVGQVPEWRRDYQHGRVSPANFFRQIRYLDFEAVGDHKYVWEINRHQHWVTLAQAFQFTGNHVYLNLIEKQLSSWLEQNPFQRGINWTSALEVAFRAISWIWTYHLAGLELSEATRRHLVSGLYQHGLHLSSNLSVYFSPNTHLLGEAVALFSIARLFPEFGPARRWANVASRITLDQLQFQVKPDGSHFEQSSYYHVYALDFFLWFYLVAECPVSMAATLERMADYLAQHLGEHGRIETFGDDDGGRLFHPFGDRLAFGRATLATCGAVFNKSNWTSTDDDWAQQAAWWLGKAQPRPFNIPLRAVSLPSAHFDAAGMIFLRLAGWQLQFDAGPLGFGGAGHSHADCLSFCLQHDGIPYLIDSGTFSYIRDLETRNRYRGTAAHNTVLVNSLNQAMPLGPFRWTEKPAVTLYGWESSDIVGWIDAASTYQNLTHRRRLILQAGGVVVWDNIEGAANSPLSCEQRWHIGHFSGAFPIRSSGPIAWLPTKFSRVYGTEEEGRSASVMVSGAGCVDIVTSIGGSTGPLNVKDFKCLFDELVTKKSGSAVSKF